MMNKKGVLTIGFAVSLFLLIFFAIFLAGGGAGAIWDIANFVGNVPTFLWIILGIFIVYKLIK